MNWMVMKYYEGVAGQKGRGKKKSWTNPCVKLSRSFGEVRLESLAVECRSAGTRELGKGYRGFRGKLQGQVGGYRAPAAT